MIKLKPHEFGLSRNKWPEVALIGSFPPPHGGISVHLQRFAERLDDSDLEYVLYNTVSSSERPPRVVSVCRNKLKWYLNFCFRHHCKILHLYSTSWLSRVMFGVVARLRSGNYILSIHGRSISVAINNPLSLRGRLTRWMLNQMDAIIACNPDIARECIEVGGLPKEKVHMIPAFIPSDMKNVAEPPDYVCRFIQDHNPILFSVGWIGQKFCDQDIYGIDMLVELIERLGNDYNQIGLVLSVNGGEKEEIAQVITEAKSRVGNRVLFVTESLDDVARIYQSSDLFLRPTNTDGDAVSIREALWAGTPVVASDIVPRPEVCVVFKSRDMNDFEAKVRIAILNLQSLKENLKGYEAADNALQIIEIYKHLKKEISECF